MIWPASIAWLHSSWVWWPISQGTPLCRLNNYFRCSQHGRAWQPRWTAAVVISREIGEREMWSFYSQANLRIEITLLIVHVCLLTWLQWVNNAHVCGFLSPLSLGAENQNVNSLPWCTEHRLCARHYSPCFVSTHLILSDVLGNQGTAVLRVPL